MKHIIWVIAIFISLAFVSTTSFAQFPPDAIWAIAFSPDGNLIVTGHTDGQLRLWDAQTGQLLQTWIGHSDGQHPERNSVVTVAWSPDSREVASGSLEESLRLWDAQTGQNLAILRDSHATVNEIIWNSDGSKISAVGLNISNIYTWDTSTYELVSRINCCAANDLAWNEDDSQILFAATGSGIGIIDAQTFQVLQGFREPKNDPRASRSAASAVAWYPDETKVVGGIVDGNIHIWDLTTGQIVFTVHATDSTEYNAQATIVELLWFDTEGNLVSLAREGTLRVWDSNNGMMLYNSDISEVPLYAASLSPDGTTLAYGSDNGQLVMIPVADILPTPTATPTLTPSPTVTPSPTPIPCPSNSACFTVGNFRAVQYTGDPRAYIERSMAAGIDPFDSPPTDGWTMIGRTNGAGDNGVLRAFTVLNNVPYAALQHPTKGCIVVTPKSLGPRTQGQTRLVDIIEQGNSARCNGDWSGLGGS